MTYRGRVKNGVVIFDPPASFPEGAEVDVHSVDAVQIPKSDGPIPSIYERYKDFIGIAEGLPSDSSVNHDHYLYGVPKK